MIYRVNMNRELFWITVALAIAVANAMIVDWSIGALPQPQAQAQTGCWSYLLPALD